MPTIKDLKIGGRLALGFGIMIALIVSIAATSFVLGEKTKDALAESKRASSVLMAMKDTLLDTRKAKFLAWNYMATGEESLLQQRNEEFDAYRKEFAEMYSQLVLPEGRELAKDYNDKVMDMEAKLKKLNDAKTKGLPSTSPEYQAAMAEVEAISKTQSDANVKASKFYEAVYDSALADVNSQMTLTREITLWGGGIAALLGIAAAWIIGTGITRPLKKSTQVSGELAHGNYKMVIEDMDRHDEAGALAQALNDIKTTVADYSGQINAIKKSQAVIEFNMDGTIVDANDNFLNAMGYTLPEIKGKHHSMFVDPAYRGSVDYSEFWARLNRGEYQAAEYKRIGRGGKEVWIQASYNPILDPNGKPFKVVKYATETTKQKLQNADYAGQIDAIGKSQAVIEFNMDGTIIQANANFLNAMGYMPDEVKGKHHSMFVDAAYRSSMEYSDFWARLNRGEYQAAEYKRIGKGGKEVWIQASYNPIMDLNGKPFKVVKYATDVTQMVLTRTENEMGMNEAVKVLTGIAAGNLTQKMNIDYKGTFAEIKKAVNATVDRLYDMVKNIIESARSVNSAASEIASGSTDLSQRTEEQASSLEETAASMEEITGTVKQNSTNAANANELSGKANQVASDGGHVVENAVSAMGSIEKSSQKISDIIGVIDEIAFQTNLLALNAAVEAARAGDAGKGFAVVASEVRSLAGRSASASKEIKALINESAQQVRTGATLVNQAGDTLKNIVSSVKQVSGIVSEIARASQEQATGIDEINTAITQMDEVTQQNAALVEESTAAATSMVEQARSLEQLMSFFKLSEGEEGKDGHSNIVTIEHNKPKPAAFAKTAIKPAHPKKPAAHSGADHARAAGDKTSYDKDWKEF